MLNSVIEIAQAAGEEILQVYKQIEVSQSKKPDKTPVTEADMKAHELIAKSLTQLNSTIPILSEEGKESEGRLGWETFWCVDPLDGTKDFLAKNDEFTVNIALIENQKPVMGVIHVPAWGTTYWAKKDQGAFKDGQKIHNDDKNNPQPVAAISNFHDSEKTQEFLSMNEITATMRVGSSIKFCRFAEGAIDVYPRLAPTSEWDTAAGHIIVDEAGGEVLDLNTNQPLQYNKENLLNPFFLVKRQGAEWKVPAL